MIGLIIASLTSAAKRSVRSHAPQVGLVFLLLVTTGAASAQITSQFRSTPKSHQNTENDRNVITRTAQRQGGDNQPGWDKSRSSEKQQDKTSKSSDYRTQLEMIREEKQRLFGSIQQRMQALLNNPKFTESDIVDSEIPSQYSQADPQKLPADSPDNQNPPLSIPDVEEPNTNLPVMTLPQAADPQLPSPLPDSANLDSETPLATVPDEAQNEQPKSAIADMIDSLSGAPAPLEAPPEAEDQPLEPLTATTVLNSPVDRLKLADSLYAAKEHGLSLQMYDAIDKTKLSSSDRIWLRYQQASCFRRLGKTAEAESIYRQIAGESNAEWLADTSRWWLDRLSDRKELDAELKQIQDVLDTFEKAKADADNATQQ